VNFPLCDVDMREYLDPDRRAEHDRTQRSTLYNLVANICHEGAVEAGEYRVHIRQRRVLTRRSDGGVYVDERWFQIQDLHVEPIMPQVIFLSESCVQIWERQDVALAAVGKIV